MPNPSTCIIDARDDESHILTDEGSIPMPRNELFSDPTIKSVPSKPLERYDDGVDRHNSVRESGETLNTGWCEDQTLHEENFAYQDEFLNMLTLFESLWDGNPGLIKAVQQQAELKKKDKRPIYSVPCHVGPSA